MTVSGWFADPGGQVNTFRWWNGEAWTRWLNTDPSSPDPGAEPSVSDPAPTPAADDPLPAVSLDLATLPPPDPADRVVRLPAAAAIVVAVVLLAVITVGAIVSITEDRPLTGPPVEPPPPAQAVPEVAYDPATRKVSFEEMQFIAPAAPFTCGPEPEEVPGTFTSGFTCEAVVHRDYDKKNHNWVNVVSMGHLEDGLQASGELSSVASEAFAAILRQNYATTKATVKKRKTQELVGVAPDGKALLVSAEVQVSMPGLPTDYDRVIAAVVELKSGRYAAWYALRADDSRPDLVQAMEDSANTVTAR